MKGLGPQAESGVKKGEVGLVGSADKEDCAASAKKEESEGLLCEWKGRFPLPNLIKSSSDLMPSSLCVALDTTGDADARPLGVVGDISLGVFELDGGLDTPSDSSIMEPFLDLAPMRLFFCLNFSSQLLLFNFRWLSELPTVVAKNLAFSRIMASESGRPCR